MMEFNATTTALGADAPGKDARPWISRHRVSSNSITRSLPDPSHRGLKFENHASRSRGPVTSARSRRDATNRETGQVGVCQQPEPVSPRQDEALAGADRG